MHQRWTDPRSAGQRGQITILIARYPRAPCATQTIRQVSVAAERIGCPPTTQHRDRSRERVEDDGDQRIAPPRLASPND